MRRNISQRTILFAGFVILAVLLTTFLVVKLIPVNLAVDSQTAQLVQARLTQAEYLFNQLLCQPALDVDRLAEVLMDTSDYFPNAPERRLISNAYGGEAIRGAGFLTYKKAYYLDRRSPGMAVVVTTTPSSANTPQPTSQPVILCPAVIPIPVVQLTALTEYHDRLVAEYSVDDSKKEAVLRSKDGQWFITNSQVVWTGN